MTSRRVLLALPALLLPLVGAAAPAQAARVSLETSYACSSSFGGGAAATTVSGALPAKVEKDAKVPARVLRVSITVPEQLVAQMRAFGVQKVGGTADGARYRVGSKKVPIRHLVLPETAVPADGPLVLEGTGKAAGFTLHQRGTYTVKVPASFDAVVTGTLAGGQSTEVPMSCSLGKAAPAALGTLRVR